MPAVAERPAVNPGKDDAMIRRQLSAAAGRIRLTDVLTGGLAVLALVLGYAAFALFLDKWLDLPAAVRKIGFIGFVITGLGLVARLVLRPLVRTVNPLYAAKKVEGTTPDAKNAVVNWVDLEDDNLPAAVKAAVQAKAAAELRDADLSRAAASKSLPRLGIAAAVFFVVLLVLFIKFSPAQFRSLVSRAFTPFSAGQITSRTRLVLTAPATGDVTVTSGQPVIVEIAVEGRIPPTDGPDKVRLRVRYSQASAEFEEFPLEPGTTNKDWQLRVPTSIIQNGCWYRVAGGDGETPEYKITVRPQPLVTGFQTRFEYPAYLRMKPETGKEPKLEAYRGTKVTLTAGTNRELLDGRMVLDAKGKIIPGVVSGEGNNSLRFELTLDENTIYRIHFTASTGEINPDPYPYPIRVITDRAPTVTIAKPTEEEISFPANGRLEIDARITDDQGIDTATLKFQLAGKPLAPKPYQGGKSFKRDADGSFPTLVETKDSIAFADLKDEAGRKVALKEGDVLEYWIEAIDNCTVPAANVGKSKVQRVKVLPPETKQEPQKKEEQKAAERKQEEQKHEQKQQDKFEKEDRTPKPQQPQDNTEKKSDEGNPMGGDPKPMGGDSKPMGGDSKPMGNDPMPMGGDSKPMGNDPKPMGGDSKPMGGDSKPMGGDSKPMGGDSKPMGGDSKPMGGTGDSSSKPTEQERQETADKANQVSKAIDKQNAEANAKELEQAAKDMMSNDPKQQQEGRERLEKEFGKEAVKQAENEANQIKKDLQSKDPKTREAAEKKVEQAVGKGAMDQAKKDADQLKKDLKSDNPETRKAAEQKLEEMKKQAGAGAAGQKPDPKEIENAVKQTQSTDPKEQRAGRDKLDRTVGEENRKKAEQEAKDLKNDLNSGNPEKQAAAEQKIKDMAKQMGDAAGPQKPDPKDAAKAEADKKEIENAVKQMQSNDPKEQEAGRKKLEEKFGKEAVKQAEKEAKKVEDDLKSGDPKRQADAEKKLERAMGKDAMDKAKADAKQLQDDLKSNDPGKKAAAEQKLKDLAAKAKAAGEDMKANNQGKPKPDEKKTEPLDPKAAAEAAKDLASDDPNKQKEAKEKLEKGLGKDEADKAAKEAEKLKDDLKSPDPNKSGPAQEKLSDMAKEMQKKAEQNAKNQGNDKGLSPEEMKKWAEKAKDLISPDQDKKTKAEKEFDDKFGKDQREALQDKLKDAKPNDPKAEEQAKKDLENWADKIDPNWRSGGGASGTSEGTPLADDPRDKLRTHELQLKTLKDHLGDKEAYKNLGLGEEDYAKLVKDMENLVDAERKEVETAAKNPSNGKPTINVNRGANKVAAGTPDAKGPTAAGTANAPPGYADAQKKFAEKTAGGKTPEKK